MSTSVIKVPVALTACTCEEDVLQEWKQGDTLERVLSPLTLAEASHWDLVLYWGSSEVLSTSSPPR